MAVSRYVPHYTVADYEQWEGRWELWSGVPIAMSPSPGRRHQKISGNLYLALRQAVSQSGCQECEVLYEIDWRMSEDTVVRPDLVIACEHQPSAWIEQTPQLVAEILSESTRHRDLLYKREMYEERQVAYYLIVDPEDETVQILENGENGFRACEPGRELSLSPRCKVGVDLNSLFS